MTRHLHFASTLLAAAALWLAATSAVSAQDVMQLDYEFKNGRLGTHASEAKRESGEGRRVVTLYADRYFGSGMGDHLGSARSGILLSRNVLLKGIGRTPLARECCSRRSV